MRGFRTLLGIVGAVLIFVAPALSGTDLFHIMSTLGFGLMLVGIFGAVVSYWKRRFGGVFMAIAGAFGFIVGGWAILGSLILLGCALSAFWHGLRD